MFPSKGDGLNRWTALGIISFQNIKRMIFLQTVIPIILDDTPSGPWTNNDTLIFISINLAFLVLYVLFALVDKLRGETWVDSFSIEEGSFVKIFFAWFFWCLILIDAICLLTYGIYCLLT